MTRRYILQCHQETEALYRPLVNALRRLMTDHNFLQLNKNKTEVIVFGAKENWLQVTTELQSINLKTTNQARNLGVVMDSDLNLEKHIKAVTKSAYNHFKNITRLKDQMSQQDLEKLVHAFIFSRLDYCNSIFTGLPKKSVRQLQLIQNCSSPH